MVSVKRFKQIKMIRDKHKQTFREPAQEHFKKLQ